MESIDEAPTRWNPWTIVQPVQFEGEERAVPRTVRLCCAAARVGDPVQITQGKQCMDGIIVEVAHSILRVERSSAA
jgi:sRNA-binding protein